jgi:thiol:disulfide interchange protein
MDPTRDAPNRPDDESMPPREGTPPRTPGTPGNATGATCPTCASGSGRCAIWALIILLIGVYFYATRSVPAAFEWVTDFEQGQAIAEQTDRPMMVAFHADWCGVCTRMEREVYSRQDVGEAVTGWVPIKVDVDAEPGVADQFHVEPLPTMVLLSAEGEVLARREGYLNADQLIALLRDHAAAERPTAVAP